MFLHEWPNRECIARYLDDIMRGQAELVVSIPVLALVTSGIIECRHKIALN